MHKFTYYIKIHNLFLYKNKFIYYNKKLYLPTEQEFLLYFIKKFRIY